MGGSTTWERGKQGGRPKEVPSQAEETAVAAEAPSNQGALSVHQIVDTLTIFRTALTSYLRHRGVSIGAYRRFRWN
ncbi:MAG: hypothetical protein QNJ22_18550 [Desulfosarcinaceae bacterium]|nr:hypothetical protein [Desulfosarcinaceae bacterium]